MKALDIFFKCYEVTELLPESEFYLYDNWKKFRIETYKYISLLYDKLCLIDKSIEFYRLSLNLEEKYGIIEIKFDIENDQLLINIINHLIVKEKNIDAIKLLTKLESNYSLTEEIKYIFSDSIKEEKLIKLEERILSYFNCMNSLTSLLIKSKDYANGDKYFRKKKKFVEAINSVTDIFIDKLIINDHFSFHDNSMIFVNIRLYRKIA